MMDPRFELADLRRVHPPALNPQRINGRRGKRLHIARIDSTQVLPGRDVQPERFANRWRVTPLHKRGACFLVQIVDIVLQRINRKIADQMPAAAHRN